jgi:hypothetical protein
MARKKQITRTPTKRDAATTPSPDIDLKGKSISDQPLPPIVRLHGFASRTEAGQPQGAFVPPGKFGRMFPNLQPLEPPEKALVALSKMMLDTAPDDSAGDNDDIPAGYTYLGQFIDHDITLDTTSLQDVLSDPLAIENFRTPALDLDSLYGAGPVAQPYLYQRERSDQFQIGATRESVGDPNVPLGLPNDLPRASTKFALIGDPRNDENLVVQQLHLLFLKFHNKLVRQITNGTIPRTAPFRKTIFEEARDLVVWHYQWIVLNDFLPRIVDKAVLKSVLTDGRKFYLPEKHSFIPLEFSGAAYRFGHSMVRDAYEYNRVFTTKQIQGDPPPAAPGLLSFLFKFTGLSGLGDDETAPTPGDWIIDWRRFFEVAGGKRAPGKSRLIDPLISQTMHKIPGRPKFSLPERNLIRGVRLKLPSGQSIARAMEFTPLTAEEISTGPDGAEAAKQKLAEDTPLWYYLLKEAQVQGKGKHLGQVGSRIVAEVFVGLLDGDPSSFRKRRPGWTPSLPSKKPGQFTMGDLVRFVGDISPIDELSEVIEPLQ